MKANGAHARIVRPQRHGEAGHIAGARAVVGCTRVPHPPSVLFSLCALFLLSAAQAGAVPESAVADVPGDDWSLPAWVHPARTAASSRRRRRRRFNVNVRVADFTWRQLQPTQGSFSQTTSRFGLRHDLPVVEHAARRQRPDLAPPLGERRRLGAAVGEDALRRVAGRDRLRGRRPPADLERLPLAAGARALPPGARRARPARGPASEVPLRPRRLHLVRVRLRHPEPGGAGLRPHLRHLRRLVPAGDAGPGRHPERRERRPADDFAWKLVFTGEDYPFGPWDTEDDLHARDAVAKGMGIRTGITEVFNFHLNHVPAYGTTIAADGHMTTDENWRGLDGRRVVATENECFNDCGFTVTDTAYAVKMANLKALQLRMNWIYVVPGPSYMATYPELWSWTRLELGKRVYDAPDAWAALREAEDTYWIDDPSHTWSGAPWVRNLERWLRQNDVAPDGIVRRGTDVRANEPTPENGTAYEGLRTQLALGRTAIYLDLDERFFAGGACPVGSR